MSHPIYLIVGPSGAGKTTLVRGLLKTLPESREAVSVTTRKPRPGEVDGVDYHFVDAWHFRKAMFKGDLAEHVVFAGEHYGLYEEELSKGLEAGPTFAIVTPEGAAQITTVFPEQTVTLYLDTADTDERMQRLETRGDFEGFEENPQLVERFSQRAKDDALTTQFKDHADYCITSTTPEATLAAAQSIILYVQTYGTQAA